MPELLNNSKLSPDYFWDLGLETIKELETTEGILASSRQEIYGCVFGRDSLITALELLKAHDYTDNKYFLALVRKILLSLAVLQGKEHNIESGEQPGKCIHEFRTSHHEHLTQRADRPWFLYPDKMMRNYDSVDATPLLLITAYRYWQKSGDDEFLSLIMPNIQAGLNWVLVYGDNNNDGLIDYRPHPDRKCGGLTTQNWMDSEESVFHEDGEKVAFPIAPVEVQAYAYLSLRLWSEYFKDRNSEQSEFLLKQAASLKNLFNRKFILDTADGFSLACGLDGMDKPLVSARSSMGHCLWASLNLKDDGGADCIVDDRYVPMLARRLMESDLFEPDAGIRTLGKNSAQYGANSYHNGSIWPHDNSLVAEGLENWGFAKEATLVRKAVLKALMYFQTPIELFVFDDGKYLEYCSAFGQQACKKQAWSAASLLTSSISIRKNPVEEQAK